MSHKVFLSLGSNIGDRDKYLIAAVKKISDIGNVTLDKVSNIYETDPVGYTDQARFLNMAAALDTILEPHVLLNELFKIENLLDRQRHIRWGPRTIDIDMLLYDELRLSTTSLTIPHPRMLERAFVLVPLKDIYEGEELLGENINDLIDKCSDKKSIKFYRKLSIYDLHKV